MTSTSEVAEAKPCAIDPPSSAQMLGWDRALDSGRVMRIHGRGAPVGLCARHADKEAGDRLLEARQERRTQQVRLSERRYVL